MDCHLCKGKVIRKYSWLFCSICKTGEAVELEMDEKNIDKWNKEANHVRKEANRK